MNETNENPLSNEGEGSAPAATPATGLTASDAATDVSKPRLSPYEQWQAKWDEHLMNGTASLSSYIRLALIDGIEYGLQPRVTAHGDHLHLHGMIRIAHVVRSVQSADEPMKVQDDELSDVAETAKVQLLKDFVGGQGKWLRVSAARISVPYNYSIPLDAHAPGAVEQFKALVENGGLFDKIVQALPTPAQGWDYSDLRRAKSMFNEYLQTTVNQFGVFAEVKLWTDDTVASSELDEKLVAFLQAFDATQEGGESDDSDN